jgi:intein-encoded DNA endonuclease-like protein
MGKQNEKLYKCNYISMHKRKHSEEIVDRVYQLRDSGFTYREIVSIMEEYHKIKMSFGTIFNYYNNLHHGK